jgi:peptide/nickel transport system substrate-binding protein
MTLALDRDGFRSSVLHGLGRPATSTFVPGTWAFDSTLVPLPYDPARSAELLDEAGWRDTNGDGVRDRGGRRFEFTLTVYQGNPIAGQVAQVLQEALAKEGVRARIETLDWPAFVGKLRSRRYEAQISTWTLDVDPDPYDNWHSSQIATGNNVTAYADPEVDRYCEAGRATFDLGERAAAYREVQARLHRDQPMTFLFHPEWIVGVDARLRGFRVPLSGPWRWFPGPLDWWLAADGGPPEPDTQG